VSSIRRHPVQLKHEGARGGREESVELVPITGGPSEELHAIALSRPNRATVSSFSPVVSAAKG
jgi:hypothetical protein